jgi:Fe-S-cluster formation regulator IscX/YfhJ
MKWTDINDLAIELSEAHAQVDPTRINFDDDPKHCGEKILEAIQQAWIDEVA